MYAARHASKAHAAKNAESRRKLTLHLTAIVLGLVLLMAATALHLDAIITMIAPVAGSVLQETFDYIAHI